MKTAFAPRKNWNESTWNLLFDPSLAVTKGDVVGHVFHGNQYTKGAKYGRFGKSLPSRQELSSAYGQFSPVGGPLGSQGGQWKRDNKTGQEYFSKPAQSFKHAMNELAAMSVYQTAGARPGIDIPRTAVDQGQSGKYYVISEKIPNLQSPLDGHYTDEQQKQAGKLFGVDAVLSHWDVVGLLKDNMLLTPDGNPVRVETGGAMAFRAQGDPKDSFDKDAEWSDLATMRTSDQGQAAFGRMTDADVKDALQYAVAALQPKEIERGWIEAGIPKTVYQPWLDTISARIKQIPDVVKKLNA